jgi:hypothetical protein
MPPQAEMYRNMTTNEPFSDYVLGNVMLPAHLRRYAFQELHHEIMVAVHGNPDNATLRAQLSQDVHDLEAVMAAPHALEVEWGFQPRDQRRRRRTLDSRFRSFNYYVSKLNENKVGFSLQSLDTSTKPKQILLRRYSSLEEESLALATAAVVYWRWHIVSSKTLTVSMRLPS